MHMYIRDAQFSRELSHIIGTFYGYVGVDEMCRRMGRGVGGWGKEGLIWVVS